MGYARWLAYQVLGLVRINRSWMTWNLVLAFIPAVLALWLFARPHRRMLGWWIGVGVFALFLPNAPYVLTDLIHLAPEAERSGSGSVILFGVLPLYGAFVFLGMSSYVLCLELLTREVHSSRPAIPRRAIELPVHALCALGIVLGRIARLNSWDTITHPRGTAQSVFTTLTWSGAPFAFVTIFLAVWAGYSVVRAILLAATTGGRRLSRRLGVTSAPATTF